MPIDVKICGLKDHLAVNASLEGGARYLGFNFYPPSPRSVTLEDAIELGRSVPADCVTVGVTVDPDDHLVDQVLEALDAIQLHGKETPERVRAVKARTGKTVIKALRIGDADDLTSIKAYADVADIILFDAKPPSTPDSLPGGNGLTFDWRLLENLDLSVPWILSGGLDAFNLVDAVRLCRAPAIDVASGVESAPGQKDVAKIRAFLDKASALTSNARNTSDNARQ